MRAPESRDDPCRIPVGVTARSTVVHSMPPLTSRLGLCVFAIIRDDTMARVLSQGLDLGVDVATQKNKAIFNP